VDEQFSRFNINQDKSLSFEEFVGFFGAWLDTEACELVETHEATFDAVEKIFMKHDKDHDFELTQTELRKLMLLHYPEGIPKPEASEVSKVVHKIIATYDTNNDKQLNFDEFSQAYNSMIEMVNQLAKKEREKIMEKSNFRSLLKRLDTKEKILDEIVHRYDQEAWVITMNEIREAAERAYGKGKVPLFLDDPPGDMDFATSRYRSDGNCQDQIRKLAENETSTSEICGLVKEAVETSLRDGQPCVLRLGHCAPDFMFQLNMEGKCTPAFFDPATQSPGNIDPDLQKEMRLQVNRVDEDYRLVITSCFTMNTYKDFFRSKLPLQHMQPIQVVRDHERVAMVLKGGLPIDEIDDQLEMMSALADQL